MQQRAVVVSLNVGLPRAVPWRGRRVRTGIFKQPVAVPVAIRAKNFDGDRQADLRVHGGAMKAVYAYPVEHYVFWRQELPGVELPWGAFGENITIAGWLEDAVSIGDRWRIGSAVLRVTEPRLPCFKLGLRFERDDLPQRFLASRRTGFYLAVEQPGVASAGDPIERIGRDSDAVAVSEVTRLHAFDPADRAGFERLLRCAALPEKWRQRFARQLAALPPR